MSLNPDESLVFRPDMWSASKVMLVLRTHDLGGTDYEPLFAVERADAQGIVAGNDQIRFHYEDRTEDEKITPIRLRAINRNASYVAPWEIMTDEANPRKIADANCRAIETLKRAGVAIDIIEPGSEDLPEAKFYLACDRSVEVLAEFGENRVALSGAAGTTIRAALGELQLRNNGQMKGDYHLEDRVGEKIEFLMPSHGRRDWDETDYCGNCRNCGHAFAGPKRAPSCAPCYKASMERSVDAKPAGSPGRAEGTFQDRVQPWMLACFGAEISADKLERNHRFLEEALELVQANNCTRSEAHQLVDYVFDRAKGEIDQEIGGVMVTLAALCLALDEDMHAAGDKELARVWTKVEQIGAKQAAKPKHSPLPQHVPEAAPESAGRKFSMCTNDDVLRKRRLREMIDSDPDDAETEARGDFSAGDKSQQSN